MSALEGLVASQGVGQGLADVVERDGSQQWCGVAHDKNNLQDLEYCLSQVNLWKRHNGNHLKGCAHLQIYSHPLQ